MAFFDAEQKTALKIERLVFHLVGPKPENFIMLEELVPGPFDNFFLDRIRAIEGGAAYVFVDQSATRARLARILSDGASFQDMSEQLAQDFQSHHGGAAAAGAFLLILLSDGKSQFFALLKYDDETVLVYDVGQGRGGRGRVTLESIQRTFVQNRAALQKVALIRCRPEGDELAVLDRQNTPKVAQYFETFLGVQPRFDDATLTEKLVRIVRDVVRKDPDAAGPDAASQVVKRSYDAARSGGVVKADNQKGFLEVVVGKSLPDDSPIVKAFQAALKAGGLDQSPITLDASRVTAPQSLRIITSRRIQIRVPSGLEDFVRVEANRIVINDSVVERYDDTR